MSSKNAAPLGGYTSKISLSGIFLYIFVGRIIFLFIFAENLEVMIIEQETLSSQHRVQANGQIYLVTIDYQDAKKCQVLRQSDGATAINFSALITDRATWAAMVELKDYIDQKLGLLPIDEDRKDIPVTKRKGWTVKKERHFKPKNCISCGMGFTPVHAHQKKCTDCLTAEYKQSDILIPPEWICEGTVL